METKTIHNRLLAKYSISQEVYCTIKEKTLRVLDFI